MEDKPKSIRDIMLELLAKQLESSVFISGKCRELTAKEIADLDKVLRCQYAGEKKG